MKLFGRTSGYYLFWASVLYLVIGLTNIAYPVVRSESIQIAWLFALIIPLTVPPVARFFNMDPVMFDFFKKKDKEANNVVKFPEPKTVSPVPQVEPPKQEEPAKIFYRLGLTDNNRVAFSMGYSEITMNRTGCQQMIDQLEFFKSQLYDEDDSGPSDDPDGGLPLPEEVKQEKAA